MVPQSKSQTSSGFFSGLLNAVKLVGSATFGLPVALAATAAIGVTFVTTWCINGVSNTVQRMTVGKIKNPSSVPFRYQTALNLVGKSWNFFLFPYKKAAGLIFGDSSPSSFGQFGNPAQTSLTAKPQVSSKKNYDEVSKSFELADEYAASQFYSGNRDHGNDGHHHSHHHPSSDVYVSGSSPLEGHVNQSGGREGDS